VKDGRLPGGAPCLRSDATAGVTGCARERDRIIERPPNLNQIAPCAFDGDSDPRLSDSVVVGATALFVRRPWAEEALETQPGFAPVAPQPMDDENMTGARLEYLALRDVREAMELLERAPRTRTAEPAPTRQTRTAVTR
jgi:hypothetical protein